MQRVIKIGEQVLSAAECGQCPGNLKFYPAEALAAHVARCHEAETNRKPSRIGSGGGGRLAARAAFR